MSARRRSRQPDALRADTKNTTSTKDTKGVFVLFVSFVPFVSDYPAL